MERLLRIKNSGEVETGENGQKGRRVYRLRTNSEDKRAQRKTQNSWKLREHRSGKKTVRNETIPRECNGTRKNRGTGKKELKKQRGREEGEKRGNFGVKRYGERVVREEKEKRKIRRDKKEGTRKVHAAQALLPIQGIVRMRQTKVLAGEHNIGSF